MECRKVYCSGDQILRDLFQNKHRTALSKYIAEKLLKESFTSFKDHYSASTEVDPNLLFIVAIHL